MERYKIGSNYKLEDLANHAGDLGYEGKEYILDIHGNNYIGESLAVIRSLEHELCVSFVLVMVKGSEFTYNCVYSDFTKHGSK